VARGFTQTHGVNFGEMFAHVAKFVFIHILLSFGVTLDLEIHQMDVKSTFLNGKLNEKKYINQPKRYEVIRHGDLVYKLNKATYDLKQMQRVLNANISGFRRCESNYRVYVLKENKKGDHIFSLICS
jgi:hypothetical protein